VHGLVLAALGRDEEALEELAREHACLDAGHIYARECSATCSYAIGAIRLPLGQDCAAEAFHQALTCVPGYVFAAIGLAAASGESGAGLVRPADAASLVRPAVAKSVDAALAKAVALSPQGKHEEAARVWGEAIRKADPGSTGWMTPVKPLLRPTGHCAAWTHTLAILRHRAG